MASADSASPDSIERAISFVRDLHNRYLSYHNHKESMAFTGLTLFTGAAGAALVSNEWPPSWGDNSKLFAVAAITALWLGVLAYLQFQLRRRRWAALRVAGCERVLANWITSPPSDEQLARRHRSPISVCRCDRFVDFFWPQKSAVPAMGFATDDDPAIYPAALVDAWVAQEDPGTAALRNERLITFAGWVMYALVVVRTVVR